MFLLSLALCAMLTSILLWVRNYSWYYGHWNADDYALCAQHLSGVLNGSERVSDAAGFLGHYSHTPNSLLSLILALPVSLGAPLELTYLWFSGVCGFLTLVGFGHILTRYLHVSQPVLLLSLALFGTHWLHLRAFGRPIPDEFGLMMVMAMLTLLLSRIEKQTQAQTMALTTMVLLLPLSRPPGSSFAAFLVCAVIAIDAYRTGIISFRSGLTTLFQLCAMPAAALATFYALFHWRHNFQLQLQEAVNFGRALPKEMAVPAIIGVMQSLPLLWLCARPDSWKRPSVRVLSGWMLFYLLMLMAVRAPMMGRHFIPLLPVLCALVAMALETFRENLKGAVRVLVTVTCVSNVAAIAYQICAPEIPQGIRYYITSR